MAHNERNSDARYETAPGSLERITFSPENDCEKSLLTLIEEHRSQPSESTGVSSAGSWIFSANPPDEVEEDEGYRFDHLMMRLGGNGF